MFKVGDKVKWNKEKFVKENILNEFVKCNKWGVGIITEILLFNNVSVKWSEHISGYYSGTCRSEYLSKITDENLKCRKK